MTAVTRALEFRILGPLEVRLDGLAIDLGSAKQQACLAMLLCRANMASSMELLMDAIWAEDPPRTARKNVQVYVAALRKLLGPLAGLDRIAHRFGGYVLRADATELDALRFERLAQAAGAARGDGPAAVAALSLDALQVWRGPMLEQLRHVPLLAREAERLNARYLTTVETWADAELALGDADIVADRLAAEVEQYPMRERMAALQMTALARCGRQGEALAVFAALRQALARELGLPPSGAVQQLHRHLLGTGPAPADERADRPAAPVVLPPDPPDVVGRQGEHADLVDALVQRRAQLVVLCGPVGVGKSTTAVHLAHRLAHRFPDGRLLLRMRDPDGSPRPLAVLLEELLRMVGRGGDAADRDAADRGEGGTAPADGRTDGHRTDGHRTDHPADHPDDRDAARRWQAWVRGRRVLLILDDAPGHAAVRALLPEGGPATTLVTARSRLPGLGACARTELSPFPVPDAVALLQRLGGHRVDDDPAAAERIVVAVGLLPMAVHRAGMRLAVLRHVTAAGFAERLERGDDALLAELDAGAGDLMDRVGSAVVGLGARQRRAALLLSSLPGPRFDLEQAAELLGGVPDGALSDVEALIDAAVVTFQDGEVVAHEVGFQLPVLVRAVLRRMASRAP